MLRRFWKSQEGNFAAILAIASLPTMAAVGGAIDVVTTYTKASRLQNALDASALAIGTKYYPGMPAEEMNQVGRELFAANLFGLSEDIDETDPLADTVSKFKVDVPVGANDTIDVSSTIFNPSFMRGPFTWNAHRSSSVRVMPGSPACVMALNPSASAAVKLQGSTQVALNGCVIAANSKASDSVSRGGSAQVAAECVVTVGKTSGLSGSSSKLACGAPLEQQFASLDPLLNVTPPNDGCNKTVPNGNNAKSLTPGTYCDQSFSGNITLQPGVYVLRRGEVKLNGNGSLVGHGVTIFLLEGASFSITANQLVDLSPPTSGPYAGITIYQARDNPQKLTINGTSGSKVSGFVYAPKAQIFFAGNSTASASACLRLIGDTIEMTGNSAIESDCKTQLGGREMLVGRHVALVK